MHNSALFPWPHLFFFLIFWHFLAIKISVHPQKPQVSLQFVPTFALLHFPLFFLFLHLFNFQILEHWASVVVVVAGEVVVGDTPEQGIMIKEYQKTSKNLVSARLVAILAVVTLIKDCYKI